jgi:membrane protease YdiL (CAAX protease family)
MTEEEVERSSLPDAAEGEMGRRQTGLQGVIGERMLAAWEIASVTLSFLIAEWIVPAFSAHSLLVGAIPLGLALMLMLLSQRERGETAREIGWRMDNFVRALRSLTLPMLGFVVLIVIAGRLTGGFRAGKLYIWQWLAWLPAWALIQQYALQGFINRRAQILCGRGFGSIILVGCVFALLHLPNPWLAVATFVGGLIWGGVYQRYPNLPALAVSHTLMSLLMVWALPPALLSNLRVGYRYFG